VENVARVGKEKKMSDRKIIKVSDRYIQNKQSVQYFTTPKPKKYKR